MFKKPLFWILIIVVLAGAGGGYYYYHQTATTAEAASTAPLQTATVKRGNLVISADGTGSIISESEVKLGFENGGVLAQLSVAVGDEVKQGDVLAISKPADSSATLQSKLTSARLSVLQAQKNLDDLTNGTANAVTLAQLQSDLTDKQQALISDQSTLSELAAERSVMNGKRCDDDTIAEYQDAYERAWNRWLTSAHILTSSEYKSLQTAEANLNWCNSVYSQAELDAKDAKIASTQAAIQLLQSQIAEDQAKISNFQSATSSDSLDIQIAQAQLDNAQANLEVVESASVSETINAPFDGTILSISNSVGDNVGTTKFITMADLSQPYLEVLLDETDLNNVGLNYEVSVTFDAIPNQTFTGHVVAINPSLSNAFSVTAIQTTVKLDPSSIFKLQIFPIGLSATVEVISAQAQNVLLVPVEALHELSEGNYAVFVVENGTPILKTVEVGLMDYTYAEIKSGLNEGEVVTTGIVETSK
jgi:HlyD family secretion protein